jgi:O-antigen/teichoic acid export membrane protein
LGLALFNWNFVIGFSIIIASGEISLNALKSWSLRNGQVQNIMLLDLARQGASILAGAAYLFLVSDPNVETASLCYAAAYLAAVLWACFRFGIRFGGLPGRPRESLVLSLGALAGAGYSQGDVLLLGMIAGDEAAGTYSIASMVAWAAAGLFLNHANSYVAEMRSGGVGASIRRIVPSALIVALAVLAASGLISYFHVLDSLGPTLAILSLFVLLRAINHVCTVALTLGRRDVTRTVATLATALFDLGLVFLFVALGSVGAALAAVISELMLLFIYVPAYKRVVQSIRQNVGISP